MRTTLLRAVMVAAGCCEFAACGTTNGPGPGAEPESGPDPTVLQTSSWDVTLSVNAADYPRAGINRCPTLSFTMYLEPGPGGVAGTLGYNGLGSTGRWVKNGGTYELAEPLSLPTAVCWTAELTQLSLNTRDTDGDRVADTISGIGAGKGSLQSGDTFSSFLLSVQLSGIPDATPPTFLTPDVLHPLNVVALLATEAMAPTSQLSLQGTSNVPLERFYGTDGPIHAFRSDVVLPFSGSWTVAGSATDLIGHPFKTLGLTSLADPGVFVGDGFEDARLAAAVTGDARIVSGVGDLPALSGSKSLLVPSRSSVTMHLARPAGAAHLRLSYRTLWPSSRQSEGFLRGLLPRFEVGVIGGVDRPTPVSIAAGDSVAVQDAVFALATPVQEVTIPLSDPGGDIVLRITPWEEDDSRYVACALNPDNCVPSPAMLVDDLRVE